MVHLPTLTNMFSIFQDSDCSAFNAFKKQFKATHDTKAPMAELLYIEEAHVLALSGEVDQVNRMTDLQLKLVAYSKGVVSLEKLNTQTPFRLRIALLAMFARRSTLDFLESGSESEPSDDESEHEDEKIITTRNHGVVMRF
ncbi:hypothetical protein N0V94_006837 [Neodidymelliopsis sp. IMI 364377]|nr:hypothetical protein N0V94_006837 [Neodidymelliopsis sp. IMI 364377]